jgi:hypothetical protein
VISKVHYLNIMLSLASGRDLDSTLPRYSMQFEGSKEAKVR